MEQIAVTIGEQPFVGEQYISAGWADSWRGSLLGILARHNLCSPFITRDGKKGHRGRGRHDTRVLQSRTLMHGFSWKTAFYRGAVLRISNRLYEQRKSAQSNAPVTALMLRTDQENAEWIRQHYGELRKGKARSRRYIADAYERGRHPSVPRDA